MRKARYNEMHEFAHVCQISNYPRIHRTYGLELPAPLTGMRNITAIKVQVEDHRNLVHFNVSYLTPSSQ